MDSPIDYAAVTLASVVSSLATYCLVTVGRWLMRDGDEK